ncbi:hypothetical protein [Pseudophaeobacter leonis]|uniref:hypothetical protein n=1 Tax=Pseudophaeobacter leonis TaxID=1144477 RepID=UPI0009F20DBF|nr:hypothetical protein [Pseudophaeobacter leonis]
MVKSVLFSAAFILAVGPGDAPVHTNTVPQPVEVRSSVLEENTFRKQAHGAATSPAQAESRSTGQEASVVEPGSQLLVVQVQGRSLSLSLMRADRTGFAVLSVPQRSVIPSLPALEEEAFRGLVAAESGCRPVGRVQVVGSRRGTVALATGFACG